MVLFPVLSLLELRVISDLLRHLPFSVLAAGSPGANCFFHEFLLGFSSLLLSLAEPYISCG